MGHRPLSVYVNPQLTVKPSGSQRNVFAKIWDSQWSDVGKFALKEAISQHVLVDLLSVSGVSRTSALTAHQSMSFNHELLAGRPHLPSAMPAGRSKPPWLQERSGQ